MCIYIYIYILNCSKLVIWGSSRRRGLRFHRSRHLSVQSPGATPVLSPRRQSWLSSAVAVVVVVVVVVVVAVVVVVVTVLAVVAVVVVAAAVAAAAVVVVAVFVPEGDLCMAGVEEIAASFIVAIFYPFSQFCEIDSSLPSL